MLRSNWYESGRIAIRLYAWKLLGSLLLALTPLAHADTLSIRADEWAPVNNEPSSPNLGVMIDLASAILKEAGHQVDYKLMPWPEALAAVKAGHQDCVVGALLSDMDSGFVHPKLPWVVSQQTVYARSDRNIAIRGIPDLEKYTLGVSNDYSYGTQLDQYRDAHIKDPARIYVAHGARPLRDLILRLNVGQLDIALETNVVMDYALIQAGLDKRIKPVGSPIRERDELYIGCSAAKGSSKDYIALFDAGLPKMRSDGRFAAILAKYGLKDWASGARAP